MSDIEKIAVVARNGAGKGPARATRRAGLVPGVVYGAKQPPVMVSINPVWLALETHRSGFFTRLFHLELDGKTDRVLCRALQRHPVTDRVLHVDFMRVAAGAVVHVAVPVRFINELESPGLKRGGVLNIVQHEIQLIGQPEAIPEVIEVDLTGKQIGDSVHMHDIILPVGVRSFITDHDLTVATIAAPSGMKAGAEEAVS